MGWGFRRKGELFVARLDATERTVICLLLEQTRSLLEPEVADIGDAFADLVSTIELPADLPADQPGESAARHPRGTDPGDRDPALARLLPDAHRGDPAVAAEFRRLAEQDLRRGKSARITVAIEALQVPPPTASGGPAAAPSDRVALTREAAEALVVALTDTRLLMGERLGLHDEQDWERIARAVSQDPESTGAYAAGIYEYLTLLQESLVDVLARR